MGIKQTLQSFGIRQALSYLEKDPEENLPKLMAWVDRFASDSPDSFPKQRGGHPPGHQRPQRQLAQVHCEFGEECGQ